jgi:hypothetical protein
MISNKSAVVAVSLGSGILRQITLDATVRCAVPRPSQPCPYISISKEPMAPLPPRRMIACVHVL